MKAVGYTQNKWHSRHHFDFAYNLLHSYWKEREKTEICIFIYIILELKSTEKEANHKKLI